MARHGYGRDYARGYDRHSYGAAGYQMGPGWGWGGDDRDPNWRGGTYHGMRMQGGSRQAAYGQERFQRQADLGGAGGFDGRYDLPEGHYDANGFYREQWEGHSRGAVPGRYLPHPRDQGGMRGLEDGGVRYDREYLRQYNADSPGLRHGGPRRSWGFSDAHDAPRMRGHDARGQRTDERGYAGYNSGGFAEGSYQGPGTRQSIPMQKGRR